MILTSGLDTLVADYFDRKFSEIRFRNKEVIALLYCLVDCVLTAYIMRICPKYTDTKTSLRKHAYSNMKKISPKKKNEKFLDKNSDIFPISAQKHRLWVLVRTASARRF